MNNTPTYTTASEIARHLGYVPHNMVALIRKWANDPHHPCPAPDAYIKIKDGYRTSLWLPNRLPEWEEWNNKRLALRAQRQSRGGKKSGTTSR